MGKAQRALSLASLACWPHLRNDIDPSVKGLYTVVSHTYRLGELGNIIVLYYYPPAQASSHRCHRISFRTKFGGLLVQVDSVQVVYASHLGIPNISKID